MGRTNLECTAHVDALEAAAREIEGPVILVAHSGGVITVAHWARRASRPVHGALLAAPADMETPMPAGYPAFAELRAGGWLPVPRDPLPFKSIVAASRNDPLATFDRTATFARVWGARLVDLGEVGHLNPASGYGPWPRAEELLSDLAKVGAGGV
jgi:predicted alpha/beta hydrolase family esterase